MYSQYISIYMYIFRHWMPGLFKASQRDQGRSNCLWVGGSSLGSLFDGKPPSKKMT